MFLQTGEHLVLEQLVMHAALDCVDEAMWSTKEMYLKVVDKFRDQFFSALVTLSGAYRKKYTCCCPLYVGDVFEPSVVD